MSKVIYEVREKVGYITLNRPEKKNAIDLEFASALFDAFDDAKRTPTCGWCCWLPTARISAPGTT